MAYWQITNDQLERFGRDGFLLVPNLLNDQETENLVAACRGDRKIRDEVVFDHADPSGKPVQLTAWNHPGDDIYGTISRCERIVNAIERMLDDEVYHYHSKMILKEAREGGAWEWHQDYGYWYNNGCLYPDLVSVSIAIDRATRENGCMQLVAGSHKLGRIEHGNYDGRISADPERTAEVLKRLELVYAQMDPGDGLFFHANTLHRSDANRTEAPRWSLICCYNARRNDPYKDSVHPGYTPLEKLPDAAVGEIGSRTSHSEKPFVRPEGEGGDAFKDKT